MEVATVEFLRIWFTPSKPRQARISPSSSSSMRVMPDAPPAAIPKPFSRPRPTAVAPSATAFTMSVPRRNPPSTRISARPATAATTSGTTSMLPRPWSSWRPPWFET